MDYIAQTRLDASRGLEQFNGNLQNFQKLKVFLQVSNNEHAKFLAASALKLLLEMHWTSVPIEEKKGLRVQVINYLKDE